jgi:hypothetical protein
MGVFTKAQPSNPPIASGYVIIVVTLFKDGETLIKVKKPAAIPPHPKRIGTY